MLMDRFHQTSLYHTIVNKLICNKLYRDVSKIFFNESQACVNLRHFVQRSIYLHQRTHDY